MQNSVIAHTSSTCSTTRASAQKDGQQSFRIVFDLLIFITLVIPVIVCEFGIEPFRRGFFCEDDTIRYPFHGNTVTPVLLGLMVGLMPLIFIILLEFFRFQRLGRLGDAVMLFGCRTPTWLGECMRQIGYFGVGIIITLDATEVGKYTIGRLRPHFMAVCQPLLLDGSTCSDVQNKHSYIQEYECRPELGGFAVEDVRQSRLSFPSGHSSLAFYAMIYITLYIQKSMRGRSSKLWRHFLQFVLIVVAWYTALSRVMDNWHHWSDVLVGSLIGVICALITTRYITKLFRPPIIMRISGGCSLTTVDERVRGGALISFVQPIDGDGNALALDSNDSIVVMDGNQLKLSIPRAETTTTLDGVLISTPPPYTLDDRQQSTVNGYTTQQFCTKV